MTITVKRVRATALRGATGAGGPIGPAGTVGGASTFIVTTTQPATPSNGASQAMIKATTPTNPAGQPAPADVQISFTHNPYGLNGQGFSHPAYTNKTVGMTVGYTPTYSKQISTEAGAGMIVEHGFIVTSARPGGGWVKGSEWHWQMTGADYAGYRPITAFGPWTGADAKYDASVSIQAALLDMKDGDGNSIISWNFRGALSDPKTISLNAKVGFAHAGNGYPWLRQYNAAGDAMINLPYVNSGNGYTFDRDVYMVVGNVGTNPLGIQSLLSLVGTAGIAAGARLVYLTTNAITGSVTGFEGDISASTRFEGLKIRNSHASGNSGMRIVGNGNLYLDFYRETDFQRWGLRLKTNGDFTIGQTEQGGDVSDALRINFTTLQTSFLYPPKLPGSTVAGLPSAATAGAGAQAYVTDLNSTTTGATAAGGGSNKGVVVSDGTNWKIVAAWA